MYFKHNESLPVKKMLGVLLVIFACLVMVGCSDKGTAETDESADKSAEAIAAVIEKEFNGPDKKYRELWDAAMATQKADMSQEEYDAILAGPEHKALEGYMEETYASYFTGNGYDNFIRATPAFHYSIFDHDYKLSASDIEINQHEKEPTLYNFTFQVAYENENGETAPFNFEGEAIVPEEAKIGKIHFFDKDGLLQEMNGNYLD